jgi:hypothetical protein
LAVWRQGARPEHGQHPLVMTLREIRKKALGPPLLVFLLLSFRNPQLKLPTC